MAYVVKSGDTLSAIAKTNGTTVQAIKDANPQITNVNLIKPGQAFTIPNSKSTSVNTGNPVIPGTGLLDLTKPENAASARLQAQADAYFAPGGPGENIDIFTGAPKVVEQPGKTAAQLAEEAAAAAKAAADKAAADKLTTTNTAAKMDAIAAISALLSSYGLGDLSASVTEAVQKGYSNDTIQLIMQDPNSKDPLAVAFQTRFPANKARLASGKSVLSASEYLAAERSYTQVLQSYGVSNLATKDKLNSFISNDVSASEVADRVGFAINRVKNADADTKAALALYYPSLNQADIVGAVLDPAEGLPALQRKIQIGEIGGAALTQGLKTVDATGKTTGINIKMGQEALANLGVTKEQARAGFQTVAEVTPRGEALSNISASGQQYGQLQAEQEAFQGLASAKRARTILTEEEKARFGGSAGTSRGSFSTQYLNKSSSSGQY